MKIVNRRVPGWMVQRLRICVLLGGTGLIAVGGCASDTGRKSDDQGASKVSASGQQTFASPQDAAAALKEAVETKNRGMLESIFGEEGRQLIFSGDRVQEKNELERMGTHLSEYMKVSEESPDRAVIHIGQRDWPFPIPIVKHGDQWSFDTAAGKDELLNRRIGANELNAISVCRAYVAAQKEYASKDRTGDHMSEYAQHFMSSEGKKDGLYWPAAEGEEMSPMGPLVAEARMEGYGQHPHTAGKPHPYQGYYFHILTGQGAAAPGGKMDYIVNGHMVKGFALIASPDKWGSSGIMTFIVNQDGKIYQKNLGEQTGEAVKGISAYDPDGTWEEVKE